MLRVSSIVVLGFVLVIGITLWLRLQWKWLFVGTAIAVLGNAIPSSIVGTLPGSTAELIMAMSLLLTEQRTSILNLQREPHEHTSNAESIQRLDHPLP